MINGYPQQLANSQIFTHREMMQNDFLLFPEVSFRDSKRDHNYTDKQGY